MSVFASLSRDTHGTVIAVCIPCRLIVVVGLVAPNGPTLALAPAEQLDARAPAAFLDDLILLVGLAAMLTLARLNHVDLTAAGIKCACVLAPHAEQQQLGDIAEIESHSAPVRAAVLTHFVPDDIGDVPEAPSFHHAQAIRQQRVGHPKVEMRWVRGDVHHGQRTDVVQRHRAITTEPLVLRGHLTSTVLELPRRVCENGPEFR